MAFDFIQDRRSERPQLDPHDVALQVQKRIGRPLSRADYNKIYNKILEYNGVTDGYLLN